MVINLEETKEVQIGQLTKA